MFESFQLDMSVIAGHHARALGAGAVTVYPPQDRQRHAGRSRCAATSWRSASEVLAAYLATVRLAGKGKGAAAQASRPFMAPVARSVRKLPAVTA